MLWLCQYLVKQLTLNLTTTAISPKFQHRNFFMKGHSWCVVALNCDWVSFLGLTSCPPATVMLEVDKLCCVTYLRPAQNSFYHSSCCVLENIEKSIFIYTSYSSFKKIFWKFLKFANWREACYYNPLTTTTTNTTTTEKSFMQQYCFLCLLPCFAYLVKEPIKLSTFGN